MSAPPSPVTLLRAVPVSPPPEPGASAGAASAADTPSPSTDDRLATTAASQSRKAEPGSKRLMVSIGAIGVLAIGAAGGLLMFRQSILQPGPTQQRFVFGSAGQNVPSAAPTAQNGPLLLPPSQTAASSVPAIVLAPATTPVLHAAASGSPAPDLGTVAPATAALPEAKRDTPTQAAQAVAPTTPTTPSPETVLMLDLAKRLDAMNHHLDDVQEQLRKQIAGSEDHLRSEMDTRDAKLGGRLDELQHREDIAEMAAQRPAAPAVPAATTHAPKGPRPAPSQDASGAETHAETPAIPHPAPVAHLPRYRIMAGGPDVAVLMDADGNSIEVKPGSDLGPYGQVKTVSQRGADYVVTAEHGVIR